MLELASYCCTDIGGKEDEATARNEELDNTSTEQEKRCQHTGAKNDDEEEDKGLETETGETLNCKTDSENTNGGRLRSRGDDF